MRPWRQCQFDRHHSVEPVIELGPLLAPRQQSPAELSRATALLAADELLAQIALTCAVAAGRGTLDPHRSALRLAQVFPHRSPNHVTR
jgi:hypothetical protein